MLRKFNNKILLWGTISLLIILQNIYPNLGNAEKKDDHTVNFGVMKYFLTDVNINDAKVAMNGWVTELSKEYKKKTGINLNFKILYFDNINEMVDLVKSKELDVCVLSSYDYLSLDFKKYIDPLMMDISDERLIKVLLINKGSNIKNLNDLKSKNLLIDQGIEGVFSNYWLNMIAQKQGIKDYTTLFSSIEKVSNNKIIKQLFFGKTDACITSLFNFKINSDLNPQIKEQTKILYNSEKIIYSITGIRKECKKINSKILTEIAVDVIGNKSIKSMMALFKKGAVVPFKEDMLVPIKELMKYNVNVKP